MSQFFFENLCSYSDFVNMSPEERQKYIDEIYGDDNPHKIFAEIKTIGKNFVLLKSLYFLTKNEHAVEFRICRDDDSKLQEIGTGAKFSEVENIPAYCKENNLNAGDMITCFLHIQKLERELKKERYLTFYLKEVKLVDFKLEEVYTKCHINYKRNEINRAEKILAEHDAELTEEYYELKKRTAEVDAEIEQKYSELEKRTAEVDAELAQRKAELQNIQEKISTANIELQKIKKIYSVEDEESDGEKVPEEFHEETNFDEYISYWQSYLAVVPRRPLTYRKEVLESVYWGLHTDQLILLTGNPGTGKTSLVRALPKCFGWDDAAIIPVQANWTDKSDLLGYYNPLEKNYMSTPFLDALLKFCRKAEKNPDEMFIICLDEMNLAHVEHYFAEFLSVLQSDRVIRLYSDELYRDIYRELNYNGIIQSADDKEFNFDEQRFMKMNLEERKYYLQICRMANMYFKYPATFKIPTNIKFFGTLNQDATTLDISPKVIDRSFVIRVEKFEREMDFYDVAEHVRKFGTLALDFCQEFMHYEAALLRGVDEVLGTLNLSLSNRITQAIKDLLDSFFSDAIPKDLWDILIASFVLPKIRLNADTDAEKIEELKNLCEEYPYSKEILEKYMTSPDKNEIDYWRA